MSETYEMEYICINCGFVYSKDVPRGEKADGRGGSCPYCGLVDGSPRIFIFRRPRRFTYAEDIRNVWGG